jgi:rSAM/selenodomain-associated transferase 1
MSPRAGRKQASNTMPRNKLGLFVRSPVAGEVKTRLAPDVDPVQARDLYLAFVADLVARLGASKYRPTVFLAGDRSPDLVSLLDPRWPVEAQSDGTLGERLAAAFAHLLTHPLDRAVIVGSDSPDLPLPFLKRAFQTLKHRDVVLGPAVDGGYYLIGLRAPAPRLFEGIHWGSATVFDETLDAIERERLSLSVLPPWYDVDDPAALRFFASLQRARRLARGERLRRVERELGKLSFTRK